MEEIHMQKLAFWGLMIMMITSSYATDRSVAQADSEDTVQYWILEIES